jgi:hypothetical protein
MSSARRRESSADDGSSVTDAGPAMEIGGGDDDRIPSQYRKARLTDESGSGVEESDWHQIMQLNWKDVSYH